MTAILELRNVDAAYGPAQILSAVDLAVEECGITTLLGPNGAGKTTTLRAICNLMVRVSGEIRFAGERIDGKATEDIVRLGVAHVPDGRGTFLGLTVEENLRVGAYTRRDKGVAADFDRLYGHFPRLKERRRQQAGTLSGGEQQMLAIARAMMLRPKLLLLDEPSFGLAPLVVEEIFRILRAVNHDEGVSMLLVEQNATLALELAHHAYLIETGSIVMGGAATLIACDDAIRRTYLGY
ncbi:MAG: ABC transporter ATP-binding protein [Verrucomicrobia bacterium]|nr:ABC transporter ATP-binding protein [Verrucomicrobiota bacterium]